MSESLQQSETPDTSQHSQMPEIFVDALEEQLDIPDDVFLNEQGVPPPPDKSRCSVIEYQRKFKEKIFRAETDEYKVRKALAKCNNRNLLLAYSALLIILIIMSLISRRISIISKWL